MYTKKENTKYHILLLIIAPVMGLIYGIKTKSQKTIRWCIFGFVSIYGSLFSKENLGDGRGHWENLYKYYIHLDFDVFWSGLINILSLSPTKYTNDDIYTHVLSYFVGTILNAPEFFFAFVAIVFAYFYSGAIVRVLSYVNWKSKSNKFYFLFFLVLFLLWYPPYSMQSVRTSTAFWVLIYAVISYHKTRKRKYLFLVFAPPLFHIGYILLSIPVWFVLFTKIRKTGLYFLIFVLSVFYSNLINPISFQNFASQTKVGSSKFEAYNMNETRKKNQSKRMEKVANEARFYKTYSSYKIQNYVLTGVIIYFFLLHRRKKYSEIQKSLFCYSMAVASFANFFSFLYAVHNRAWVIAGMFTLSFFTIYLSQQHFRRKSFASIKIRFPLFIFSVAFIPYILYQLSAIINYTSPYIVFMPMINWIEPEMKTNIKGFIEMLL